jgi:hypothetical protein
MFIKTIQNGNLCIYYYSFMPSLYELRDINS